MRSLVNNIAAGVFALGVIVAGATTAQAEDLMEINEPSWKHFYLLGSVGAASYNLDQGDVQSERRATGEAYGVVPDNDDFAYRVGVGYRFNDVFAGEFAYANLGSAVQIRDPIRRFRETDGQDLQTADTNYDAVIELSGLARFRIPELSDLTPFFRVGGTANDGDKQDGFYAHFGAGLEWKLVRLEYIRYNFDPEPVDTGFIGLALPLSLFAR